MQGPEYTWPRCMPCRHANLNPNCLRQHPYNWTDFRLSATAFIYVKSLSAYSCKLFFFTYSFQLYDLVPTYSCKIFLFTYSWLKFFSKASKS